MSLFRCPVCIVLCLLPAALAAQNVVTTIAGIDASFAGDGQPAVNVPIGYLNGVATDGAGNVYFTDPIEHLVLRVSPSGILNVIAGNGIAGYSGDGGPAISAAIGASDNPEQYSGAPFEDSLGGIVVDPQGNIYFADGQRVRRVSSTGIITTVAGGGTASPGDGAAATLASLGIINGLALDAAGNLYFCETNRVRMVTPSGTLSTYAGGASAGFAGDGGPAAAALLAQPEGLAFDSQGNLYVADGDVLNFPSRIRKIAQSGIITTVAGGGSTTPASGLAPLSMDLSYASGLAVDASNALYVFSPYKGYLLKIANGSTTLITSVVASAFTSNVQAATAFVIGQRAYDNSGIALDAAGNLYVADSRDSHLVKISASGFLTSIAGNGQYSYGGDGGPALGAMIQGPSGMTQTPDGTVYFLDTLNARVRAIAPNGVITTAVSSANFAPLAVLEQLNGIASDTSGNVYVLLARRLIEYTPSTGTVQILVNQSGVVGTSGDGGPALAALLENTGGLARDAAGNLYIADLAANNIRKVTADGIIRTFAGTGAPGVSPDGSVAAISPILSPSSLLADGQGGLYFLEQQIVAAGGTVLRYITPNGLLKTIAGNTQGGFSGDGGPATQAALRMQNRTGLTLDAAGNLYVADGFNHRVRMITPNGVITTFAGSAKTTTSGDGGQALKAGFSIPRGLMFDARGDLYISDIAGNRIRAVLAAPPAIHVAPAQMTFSARAGGALTAPQELTVDAAVGGVPFTVTASQPWVVVNAGGFTPRLMGIRVDPSNLASGAYQATVTITAPLANPGTSTVQIAAQVAAALPPALGSNKSALAFTFPSNPAVTESQTVKLSNSGSGTIAFTASAQTATGGNWLSVGTSSGNVTPQTPGTVTVIANPAGLSAGTYTGIVTFSGSSAGSSAGSITIPVNLTISTLAEAIRLSRPALSFTAVSGGGVVPPGTFSVTNIGTGAMNFSVSTQTLSGGPWLSATASSGTATSGSTPPSVAVTVSQKGLAPGFYFGVVRIDAPGAANTPHVVSVALNVLTAGSDPGPVIVPSEIVFTAVQGQPPPGSRNLLVYNVSATPQTYVSSVTAAATANQFSFAPDNATLALNKPTRIVVQPLTSSLPAGVYNGDLTLQFSDGLVRRVGLRTIVTPPTASPADRSSETDSTPRAVSGCAPTQLVPSITTLGQSFGEPAAWPVALEAQITDDCGNPLNTGDVTATFSNGDPPLSLLSIQNGIWQSTWQAGNNPAPVTITLTATDPARNITGAAQVTGNLGSPSMAPVLAAAVSGASFQPNGPLSPGSIVSLFGQNLANGSASAPSLPLGTTLSGATVAMAGAELPLIYSANGQINAVIRSGINTNTRQQILVERGNTLSIPIELDVAPTNPAVFGYSLPGDPATQGAIINAITYAVADPSSPVKAGDVLAIFCTGLGAVNPAVPDGAGAPSAPLATTVVPAQVTIGGVNANVGFSGLSPGFVGLYQINATVPSGVPSGSAVPVIVSVAGASSPPATIAVQ